MFFYLRKIAYCGGGPGTILILGRGRRHDALSLVLLLSNEPYWYWKRNATPRQQRSNCCSLCRIERTRRSFCSMQSIWCSLCPRLMMWMFWWSISVALGIAFVFSNARKYFMYTTGYVQLGRRICCSICVLGGFAEVVTCEKQILQQRLQFLVAVILPRLTAPWTALIRFRISGWFIVCSLCVILFTFF